MPIPVAFRGLPILTLLLTLVSAALAGHTSLYGATQGGLDSNCQFGGGCGVVFKIAP